MAPERLQEGLQGRLLKLRRKAELLGQRELLMGKGIGQGRAWHVGRSVWLERKVWVGGDSGGRYVWSAGQKVPTCQ